MSGRRTRNIRSPISMKWPIPAKTLYAVSDEPGQCLRSKTFNASKDVKYYLEIFPKGDTEEHRDETWIFLALEYSGKMKIEADFKISVESAKKTFSEKHVFEKLGGHGARICTTDELLYEKYRYIFDYQIIIKIDGMLKSTKCGRFDNIKERLYEDDVDSFFSTLWNQEETKDFSIVVGEQEITVHKNIFAARSPVFAKMLQSGMKEAQESKVEIKDFTFEIVEIAIKFCYYQYSRNHTTLEEKMKILQFFDKYEIQPLKDNLESYLIDEIDAENVCLLTNCSLLSNAPMLEKKCSEFLQDCLDKKQPINDYDLLDKDFALDLLKNAFFPVSK